MCQGKSQRIIEVLIIYCFTSDQNHIFCKAQKIVALKKIFWSKTLYFLQDNVVSYPH